ncbi:hypothetical protein LLH00_12395 [bacterium]|nr:hypothetical protein [bacterium]
MRLKTAITLLAALLATVTATVRADNRITGINTINLRDRVVLLGSLELRKHLIVAFDLDSPSDLARHLNVRLTFLSPGGDTLGTGMNHFLEGAGGDVSCGAPYDLPQGVYRVTLESLDSLGAVLGAFTKTYDRRELGGSYFAGQSIGERHPTERPFNETTSEPAATSEETQQGYILYRRDWLRWVYENSRPTMLEKTDSLHVTMAANEYEPLTFSLYGLRDLDSVRVSLAGDLTDSAGAVLPRAEISIGVVESLPTVIDGSDHYRQMPRLIARRAAAGLASGRSRRFWLTVHAPAEQAPGLYSGRVRISAATGEREAPLSVRVLPVRLPDEARTDVNMCETYEFYELFNDWPDADRALITRAGRRVYEDYRRHGMNGLWPHSGFHFKRAPDGAPRLDELFAALEAAKTLGFTRPVVWFCGSLVHTAKPRHPGNVRLYDKALMTGRMRELVSYVNHQCQVNGWPEVLYEPSDEPADNADYPLDRGQQARDLLAAVREAGGRTAETGTYGLQEHWLDLPVLGSYNENLLPSLRAAQPELPVWVYRNETISQNMNLCFTRYYWGFSAWRSGFDGTTAWTFQNTMNGKGDPFTDLDGEGADVMVALPSVDGPLATPYWEAVREGVDDLRYIDCLRGLIKSSPDPWAADSISGLLEAFRAQALTEPSTSETVFGGWKPDRFEERRQLLVDWITRLSSPAGGSPGDFNSNGRLDMQDAVRMVALLAAGSESAALDLNADGVVGLRDLVWLLLKIASTPAGG